MNRGLHLMLPDSSVRVRSVAFVSSLAIVGGGVCIPRFVRLEHWSSPWLIFGAAGALGLAIVGTSCRWDRATLGLTLRARQGAWFWLMAGVLIGVAVAIACAAAILVARAGHDVFRLCQADFPPPTMERIVALCLFAPVTEELLWRVVLCTAAARLLGPRAAIAVTGAMFAAAHWMYGVSGPDNLIAGFFLAWAFLRSGTFVVPLALHTCGNALALALQGSAVLEEAACGLTGR
jgi:membrane protease YdiL (CAAX protease family)